MIGMDNTDVEATRIALSNAGPITNAVLYNNGKALAAAIAAAGVSVGPPAGTIVPFAGQTAPNGYLMCDGATIEIVRFPELYGVISTLYNTGGEPSGTFRLPDLQGRVPVGKGTNADVSTLNARDSLALASRTPKHTHSHAHTHDLSSHTHQSGSIFARWVGGGNIYYTNIVGGSAWGNNLYGGVQTIGAYAGVLSGGISTDGNTAGPSNNTSGGASVTDTGLSGPAYVTINYLIRT